MCMFLGYRARGVVAVRVMSVGEGCTRVVRLGGYQRGAIPGSTSRATIGIARAQPVPN